jgi:nitroreductase
MNIQEALQTRRTISKFLPAAVDLADLDEILVAGIWAQNHRMTQPWRFTVIGPRTHQRLSQLFGRLQSESLAADQTDVREAAFEAARQKILARPKIVVVSTVMQGDSQQRKEDYAATACAIQNIQLAAWAKGVGMQWSTSHLTRNPATYELIGCDPGEEEIVGFLFFGYPAEIPAPRERRPLAEVRRTLP